MADSLYNSNSHDCPVEQHAIAGGQKKLHRAGKSDGDDPLPHEKTPLLLHKPEHSPQVTDSVYVLM